MLLCGECSAVSAVGVVKWSLTCGVTKKTLATLYYNTKPDLCYPNILHHTSYTLQYQVRYIQAQNAGSSGHIHYVSVYRRCQNVLYVRGACVCVCVCVCVCESIGMYV
jgi:uncharacterized Fe-S cluster-containing radical SAM superfamily enzyme